LRGKKSWTLSESDESSPETMIGSGKVHIAVSYCTNFLRATRKRDYSEACDLFPLRERVSFCAPSLSLRYSLIRQFRFSFRSCFSLSLSLSLSLSHRTGILTWFFPFFYYRVFVSPREVEGILKCAKGGCDLLAPFVRLTAYDFRRQGSGQRSEEIFRSDWKPKWIFPEIFEASCIRTNINDRDEEHRGALFAKSFHSRHPKFIPKTLAFLGTFDVIECKNIYCISAIRE